ncbi:ABC transporter substrate-binding protein [Pontibacillus halophilus JSM 076056 = DSM 19796]|uniref:ABC transporter substrate-binding protein n=1 Tax=Pontibacillus halophilus JSM 076056 = DSM 19796 TaxID=1385510 RepID=A0A0A5GMW6_9BACI|nr:cobalamin-binding protein [Pontibacillus halophilus]KGX92558.1 ABC transporter substrate-binding protein [Pontibacillus halophilus JSM 076056 = DSM 19796]
MRIVSICPSNTEILAYLGAMEDVVAVDDFSDWPQSVQALPKVGPDLSIDMDAVEQLEPDLVVASLSVPGMERNIEELERRKLPYVILNPNSLKEILEDVHHLGVMIGREERAAEVTTKCEAIQSTYREQASTLEHLKTLYWEWWPKPVFTPGGPNWLTELSLLAGGRNLYEDAEQASVQTDWDDVRRRNPDVVCMVWVGVNEKKMKPSLIRKRPGWDNVPAIRDDHIYPLPESLYCRPSPRLFYGLQKLAYLLHPTVFPEPFEDPLLKCENLEK